MAFMGGNADRRRLLPDAVEDALRRLGYQLIGISLMAAALAAWASLLTWSMHDPSLNHATREAPRNLLGLIGAGLSDMTLQSLGLAATALFLPLAAWGWHLAAGTKLSRRPLRLLAWPASTLALAATLAVLPTPSQWPLPSGLGGIMGDLLMTGLDIVTGPLPQAATYGLGGLIFGFLGITSLLFACGIEPRALALLFARQRPAPHEEIEIEGEADFGDELEGHDARPRARQALSKTLGAAARWASRRRAGKSGSAEPIRAPHGQAVDPHPDGEIEIVDGYDDGDLSAAPLTLGAEVGPDGRIEPFFEFSPRPPADASRAPTHATARHAAEDEAGSEAMEDDRDYQIIRTAASTETRPKAKRIQVQAAPKPTPYVLPSPNLLKKPPLPPRGSRVKDEVLQENARALEGVLADFGVKGEIINVRPGPVVTLYELEPAPGTRSSRVIGLSDDIARAMSAIAARVAVIPGRNAIGVELPNERREMVYLRALLQSGEFAESKSALTLALGKNIGGEPITVDLARMPHLLIAGTTGSGKSVGVNTMILSLLYRLTPEQCKFIMVDPKMLELSVYDGIPHLLAPVVTDPKKAVVALKWTVREMEERYKRMSKLGVRNINGYNARVREAQTKGEPLTRTVQTGFDRESGQAVYEQEEMNYEPMPYIVVIVDEMADLMMVAGKDIEGAVQRLAQMARAAGIHMITATQRPSVDVITGTIKANFPTRISFQVTSKIDSRTILGEQGAEQLLGQGDMLYMAGGGRITRVHGPFVSDEEVEKIVRHLKKQGVPQYLESITEEDAGQEGADGAAEASEAAASGNELYDKAVAVVVRDGKASTSYVQRRLSIGYNRAASLIERMEQEGVISAANHAGKREVLVRAPEDEAPY